MKRIFGRLYKPDKQDKKFLIHPNMRKAAGINSRYWYVGSPLDQGSTPQCVAYAGYKYLMAGPVRNTKLPFTPKQLYRFAQDNDEWPGYFYDGTSVRGLFKYLNKAGYIPRYEWAPSLEVVVAHILTVGPLVAGTEWYLGMMKPDSKGYIHPTGTSEGGHGYVIHGANKPQKKLRIINSWGKWGLAENGMAWIRFEEFEDLLKSDGEAGCATEIDMDK
jgi:hypothetical protein